LSEKGGQLQKATEHALPNPGAVSLPQIFIKIHHTQEGPHPGCYTGSDVQWLLEGFSQVPLRHTPTHFYKGPVNMKKQFIK
jgi:hypothetical protein